MRAAAGRAITALGWLALALAPRAARADAAAPSSPPAAGAAKPTPPTADALTRDGVEDEFYFELRAPHVLYPYAPNAEECATTDPVVAREGTRLDHLATGGATGTFEIVRVRRVSGPTPPGATAPYLQPADRERYFCLDKAVFDRLRTAGTLTKRYLLGHTGEVYGLSLVLPFKLRRATAGFNTQLTQSLTIAGVFGERWRISGTRDYHLDFPVVHAGLTTLELEQGRAPAANSGNKQTLGLTAGIGAVIELDSFQIGLMAGFDRAQGDDGKGWVYNDKVWYSFSIGYAFLSNTK